MDKHTKLVVDAALALPTYERSIMVDLLIHVLDNGMQDSSALEAALRLPIAEQWIVVDQLLATLKEDHSAEEWEESWRTEIKRRTAEIDAGAAKLYSWDEVREAATRVVNGG